MTHPTLSAATARNETMNSIDLPTEQETGLTPEQLQSVIEAARDTREDYTPKTPILFPDVSYLG